MGKNIFVLWVVKRHLQRTFLSVWEYDHILYIHVSAAALMPLDALYYAALIFITGDKYNVSCMLRLGEPLCL